MVRLFCDTPYKGYRCLCLNQPGHCHARHDEHPVLRPCLLNPYVQVTTEQVPLVPEKEEETSNDQRLPKMTAEQVTTEQIPLVPEKEEDISNDQVTRCLKEMTIKNWLGGPCVTPFEEVRPKIGHLRLKRKIPRPISEKPQDRWAGLFIPKKIYIFSNMNYLLLASEIMVGARVDNGIIY